MGKVDIKYLGIPNVCFSFSDENEDVLRPKYVEQRKERGFDDTEMWGLYVVIAKFILPRISRLRDIELESMDIKDPKTKIEKDIVKRGQHKISNFNKCIRAFELAASDEPGFEKTPEYKEGIKIYNKIYLDLWT